MFIIYIYIIHIRTQTFIFINKIKLNIYEMKELFLEYAIFDNRIIEK